MQRHRARKALSVLSGFVLTSLQTFPKWYEREIRPNDQLGYILQDLNFKEFLYGKDGLISKVLARNPHISNPDLIFPGQIVQLPQTKEDLNQQFTVIETRNKEEQHQPNKVLHLKSYQDNNWTFRLGPHLSYQNRDVYFATTSGKVSSDIITGLYGDVNIPLNSNWALQSKILLRRISFTESTSRTFQSDSKLFLKLSFGVSRKIKKLQLLTGINVEKMPFIIESNPTTVTTESFYVISPYLGALYPILKRKNTLLMLGLSSRYLFPSSGSTRDFESGFGFKFYLDATKKINENHSISVITFADYVDSKTTLVEHQDLEAGIQLLYGFKI